jgi:hypothetical protein
VAAGTSADRGRAADEVLRLQARPDLAKAKVLRRASKGGKADTTPAKITHQRDWGRAR